MWVTMSIKLMRARKVQEKELIHFDFIQIRNFFYLSHFEDSFVLIQLLKEKCYPNVI